MLAAPVQATIAVPAFDCAAMDGYAIRGTGPWTVIGRILAGRAGEPVVLRPGTAVEIATGAPVPVGAEAVLPYERCHRDGATVTGERGPREHIRRTGADVRASQIIIPAGRTVTATVAAAPSGPASNG